MSAEDNVRILTESYALWNDSGADSVAHWMDMIAENVKWRSLANGAPGMEFTGSCECREDVVRYFEGLGKEWALIHYTVDEFIAQGDRVVAIGHCGWTNKRTGKTIETPKVDIITMRDSKIVEFMELYDTAMAVEAAR